MFENKYSKLLTGALIAGIVIIIIVIIFFAFNFINSYYINKDNQNSSEKFEGELNGNKSNTVIDNTITGDVPPIIGAENVIGNGGNNSSNTQTYKGFPMVGTIEIPAINLKCPVLEDASKSAIEVAVGVYYGSGLNQIGNTVIAGHNYRNGTFFSNNKKLVEGDKINITDLSGSKVTYKIYKTYTTSPEDSEYLDRDTKGKREISLTTCTDDTKNRLIIWAIEE